MGSEMCIRDRFNDRQKDRWERSFNDRQMGSFGTVVQRSSIGIVGNDRSTIVKGYRWERSFNDRQKVSLGTVVQRSKREIVCNERSTILKRDRWERSFNDPQKGSLGTIVQRSSKGIVGNDRSTIQKCCLLYTSPSPRDLSTSRMPSSA